MKNQINLLNKYYDRTASDSEKRRLARMLNYQDLWEEGFDDAWDHAFGEMSPPIDERVTKRINHATRPKRNVGSSLWWQIGSVAVSLLLATSTIYFWRENNQLGKYGDMSIVVDKGQKSNLQLPDGTMVYLNSSSQLTYGSNFNGNKREVELVGEAYFEVAKDASSPFIVSVGGLKVNALGTAFNIQAYPDQEIVTTFLSEGSVKVIANSYQTVLKPGEVLRYNNAQNAMHKESEVDKRIFVGWRQNEMVFDEVPFSEIIRSLERYYNVKFQIKNEALTQLTFTGTLHNSSLQSTLNALEFTSSVCHQQVNDTIVLDLKKKPSLR